MTSGHKTLPANKTYTYIYGLKTKTKTSLSALIKQVSFQLLMENRQCGGIANTLLIHALTDSMTTVTIRTPITTSTLTTMMMKIM